MLGPAGAVRMTAGFGLVSSCQALVRAHDCPGGARLAVGLFHMLFELTWRSLGKVTKNLRLQ